MAPNYQPLFLLLANCIILTYADGPARLVRDGIGDIWGFSGVSYKAVNYIPVCGALTLTDTDLYSYWTSVATCDASMSAYNQTTDTSAVFDYTGTLSNVQIGTGSPVCMCFSLGGAQGKMDMCINILSDGTPEDADGYAGGTFNPNADKALPLCKDVDVPSISASIYSKLGATTSNSTPASSTSSIVITTTSGTVVRTLTALVAIPNETTPTGNSENEGSSGGAERDHKTALGVGIGMVSELIPADGVVVEKSSALKVVIHRVCQPLSWRLGASSTFANSGRMINIR